jgi:hypothetical protein
MRIMILPAVLSLALVGCSSDPASNAVYDGPWATGEAVIEDVNEFGFDCAPDSDAGSNQILDLPATQDAVGGKLVLCDGFQVVLMNNPDAFYDDLRKGCGDVTSEELGSDALQREVVIGSNYVISGTGSEQLFPEGASAAALADAFSGKVQSLRTFYDELCADVPTSEESAPAES